MAQRRNVFTKMGRPAGAKKVAPSFGDTAKTPAASPMDNFDTSIPGAAFRRGGSTNGCKPMPKYHPDPGFCGGGKTR